MNDQLTFVPVLTRLDLVSPTVASTFVNWQGNTPVDDLLVAEIDPAAAGGADFCARYGFSHDEGANCVIVRGLRGSVETTAAVVMPVGARADFNGVVRRHLNARQVSLAPLDEILSKTQMEYGSITPVGLPEGWPVLLDKRVSSAPRIVIGSGQLRAKLYVPGRALLELGGAVVVEGLSRADS